jgi:hypothetical protein
MTCPRSVLLPAAFLALALPAAARADHGSGDGGGGGGRPSQVRVAGTCGKGASAKLELKRDDTGIEVRFQVDRRRGGETWRVVLVQEGQVAWRGRGPTGSSGGSLRVIRRIRDLGGAERITVRGTGPGGITCVASAILPG